MISLLLFTIIGIELNLMHGIYLAVLIIGMILWLIKLIINCIKLGIGGKIV